MTFDLTLLGATGFAGSLTADHCGAHLPAGARWAIAGRDARELESVASRIADSGGVVPEIVVANIHNPHSMRDMAEATRVLISTVGPYLQLGEPAVKAAAEAGIGYVDLTGEPQFVDEMWTKHHRTAEETGARLVHACGFDSVPYDLGVLATVRRLPLDVPITVSGYIRAKASFSGSTFHSAIRQMGSAGGARKAARERKRQEARPEDRRIRGGGRIGPATAPISGWGAPLPTIDPQIVLRSARALERYGPDFRYEHYAHFRTRRMMAASMAAVGGVALSAQIAPLRAALLKIRTRGDGPSEEERAGSWFTLSLVGEGGGETVLTTVSGGDPGYTETAKMLGQSAMCLAFDELPDVVGQTTTAEAMGPPLITRLQNVGIDFETRVID